MFKKRVLKLERVFQVIKDASEPQIVISPFGMPEGTLAVQVDGETLFTGTPEECDRWTEKKYGPMETIFVGVPKKW